MRQFAVIGIGNFGYYLARHLAELGEDVLAIDRNPERVQLLKDVVSHAVVAEADDRETLQQLGVADVDVAVVSVGERMDASILITLYLKELKVREVMVKAITEDHGRILQKIGADGIIFPEKDTGIRVAENLHSPNIIDHLPLGRAYGIIELAALPEFVGHSLAELKLRNRYHVQVIAIRELVPERFHVAPAPDFVIKDSDSLVLIGENENLERIRTRVEKG
ncbi:MAG: TrkA family potassium uptake protein [Deltaproteobacteria bacterium]|nr:TrkA family potassium uptake protein [Candidatus Anaeroferrophillacea bacterium]